MVSGHYAVAYAVKKVDKSIGLGWLFISVEFIDILWGIFVLLGFEKTDVIMGANPSNPLDKKNVWLGLFIVTTHQALTTLRHPPSLVPSSIRPCMIEGPRSIHGPLQGRGMISAFKLPHSFA
jgi:hypothetical protein